MAHVWVIDPHCAVSPFFEGFERMFASTSCENMRLHYLGALAEHFPGSNPSVVTARND